MNCPYCEIHIDEHEALDCLNLWVMQDVFGWTTSIEPYTGDFYPKGSYFVIWHQPDDFMPETLLIVSQAFDKDGNNLRSIEENPFGMWEEGPLHAVPFFYSTDGNAALELWKKLGDDNWIVSVAWGNGRDGRKYASVQMSIDLFLKADLLNRPITQMDAKALTIPLALCRAAIKATIND